MKKGIWVLVAVFFLMATWQMVSARPYVPAATTCLKFLKADSLAASGDTLRVDIDIDELFDLSDPHKLDSVAFNSTKIKTFIGNAIRNATSMITAADITIQNATPQFDMYDTDSETGASKDTSAVVLESDGAPSMTFYGADGDAWGLTINTSDAMLFQNATTYEMDGDFMVYDAGPILCTFDTDIEKTATPASIDSAAVLIEASDEPSINLYATDGDAWSVAINTSDQFVVTGASGGYDFQGGTVITDSLIYQTLVEADTGETVTVSAAESGKVYVQTRSSTTVTFTLPEAAAGLTYTFVCGHADSEILITPQAGDAIVTKIHAAENGTALAPAAGTGIKNTAATNVAGDAITLVALDAVTWYSTSIVGLWASQ